MNKEQYLIYIKGRLNIALTVDKEYNEYELFYCLYKNNDYQIHNEKLTKLLFLKNVTKYDIKSRSNTSSGNTILLYNKKDTHNTIECISIVENSKCTEYEM